ncbi:DUF3011 domain-containing protein [Nostoc sp. MS1]|uniref:DUF3011 domain-containing protein n=1 Tax=Nostoc sp. MS1 TaxID=2764711 RepID=UPI001CC52133|nr:DUF3011 domain-containing protein [Nostoc sp. MS1]
MAMRFSIIAATFVTASVSLGTLFGVTAPASAQEIISCSSYDNRTNTCAVPPGRVRLVRQLSDASCQGNWGSRGNRIWVRNGCRAEFVVGNGRNNRNGRYYRNDRDDRYYRNDRDDRYYRNDRDDRYYRNDRDDRYYRNDRDDRYYRNNRYDIYNRNGRNDIDDRYYQDDRYNR